MNEQRAIEILKDYIQPDGSLDTFSLGQEQLFVAWRNTGDGKVGLSGSASADELEAILWWMRNHS